MKVSYKLLIALAVCLLIGAQVYYSTTRGKAASVPAPVTETEQAQTTPEPVEPARVKPTPDQVTTIILSSPSGDRPVWLSKNGDAWQVETLHGAQANADKVQRFLQSLLGPTEPVDTDTETGATVDDGILVSLGLDNGQAEPYMILGLRPQGSFDKAYARLVDSDELVLLPGDVRGDIGLWKNAPGVFPESTPWLLTTVFSFDPAETVGVRALYPDHRLDFARDETGEWSFSGSIPVGDFNADAFAGWLDDLADFRIATVADPANMAQYGLDAPSQRLDILLADGTEKTIVASPNRMGDGMWVATSEMPGQVFLLPDWRFQQYFQPFSALFPNASPQYSPDAIQFIDIRRGGESVKLTRRNNEWQAVATSYPIRTERIVRLASVFAGWRPLDIADAGARQARPVFGGPLVEITLNDGTVHQYRMGGWHPVFPWRYVLVDNKALFSAADADALSMFPDFAEIMDLGMVFGTLDAEQITRLELSMPDVEEAVVSAGLTATGEWEVVTEEGRTILQPQEVEEFIHAPLQWRVAGFYRLSETDRPENMFLLRLSGGGVEKQIVILSPQGRDIPYIDESDRAFLAERTSFFNWFGVLRAINLRISEEAIERLRIEAEAASEEYQSAEADAIAQALEQEQSDQPTEQPEPPSEETPAPVETDATVAIDKTDAPDEIDEINETDEVATADEPVVEPEAPAPSDETEQVEAVGPVVEETGDED